MYAKIASALLISAALTTPNVALAAGGNFDDPLKIDPTAPAHVDAKGPLTIKRNERVTFLWAWVYQPSTRAGQVYFQNIGRSGPARINWRTTQQHLLNGNFAPGPAWGVAIVLGTGGNLPFVWWDHFDLTN